MSPICCAAVMLQWLPSSGHAQELDPRAGQLIQSSEGHAQAGRFASALDEAHAARLILQELGDGSGEALALNLLGRIFTAQNQVDSAMTYHRMALERSAAVADDRQAGNAEGNLASLFGRQQLFDSTLVYARRSAESFRRAERPMGVVLASMTLGEAFLMMGRPDSAVAHLEYGAVEGQGLGMSWVNTLGQLGQVYLTLGRPADAAATLLRARGEFSNLGALGGLMQTEDLLGEAYRLLDQPDSALSASRRALALAGRSGQPGTVAQMEWRLQRLFVLSAQPDSARPHADRALRGFRAAQDAEGIVRALWGVSGLVPPEFPDSAWVLLHEARERSEQMGSAPAVTRTVGLLASTFLTAGVPDSAVHYGMLAVEGARDIGDAAQEATALMTLGSAHKELGNPERARDVMLQALTIHEARDEATGAGLTLLTLASVVDDEAQAIDYLERSTEAFRQAGDPDGEALVLVDLGLRRLERDVRLGAQTFAEATSHATGVGTGITAATLAGRAYLRAGEPDSARVYMNHAAMLAEDGGGGVQSIAVRTALADFLRRRDVSPDMARRIEALTQGLDELEGSGSEFVRRSVGQAMNTVAQRAIQEGQLDSATVVYTRQLGRARESGDSFVAGQALMGMAQVQSLLGRTDSARALVRSASDAFTDSGDAAAAEWALGFVELQGETGPAELERLRRDLRDAVDRGDRLGGAPLRATMGAWWNSAGQPDSAVVHLTAARDVFAEMGDRAAEAAVQLSLAQTYTLFRRPEQVEASARRALELSRSIGERRTEGVALGLLGAARLVAEDPGVASAYFDTASVVISGLRREAGDESSRLSFADNNRMFTDAWISAKMDESAVAALAVHERGRSQELLELIAGARTIEAGRDLSEEGFDLIWPFLDRNAVVLSFWTASIVDFTGIWAFSSERPVFVEGALVGDSLRKLVRDYRRALTGEQQERAREAFSMLDDDQFRSVEVGGAARGVPADSLLAQLAAVLLPEPVLALLEESGATELVIVPDGVIGLVPFAALPTESGLLGERFAIRYAPSLGILGDVESRPEIDRNFDEALVVGDPTMPTETAAGESLDLPPLLGARAEGEWLAERLGSELLTGDAASESALRGKLAAAPLVHLATHGFSFSSERRERDSFIALAPDDENDGLLTVADVLSLDERLSADLVVLSACQTGLGNLREAEGTVGLQRAFLAKGARSVLVSLWSVSDESTQLLMRRFYEHWLDGGTTKAEALRRAQEDVRATEGFEDPRYWAAFQLVGAG